MMPGMNSTAKSCLWTSIALFSLNSYYGSVTLGKSLHSECSTFCVRGNKLPAPSLTSKQSAADGKFVVTDSVTGLKWQQEYVEGKTWQAALKYCENLNYAGYSNWRLPNKNELASLFGSNLLPTGTLMNDVKYFWTSSTSVSDPDKAWYVGNQLGSGVVEFTEKTDKLNVRCVRSE